MERVSPTQWNYRSQVAFSKPTAFSPSFLDGSGNNLLYVCYIGKYVVICRVLARKIPEIDHFWFYNTEPNFPDIFGEKKKQKQKVSDHKIKSLEMEIHIGVRNVVRVFNGVKLSDTEGKHIPFGQDGGDEK